MNIYTKIVEDVQSNLNKLGIRIMAINEESVEF